MNVILLERVANLGDLGDAVKVKAGYGRNFLIPHGRAVPATPENVEKFEARRAELEKAASERLSTGSRSAWSRVRSYHLSVFQRLGCCRGSGIRLPGRLDQPLRSAAGMSADRTAGRDQNPRSITDIAAGALNYPA